MIAEQPEVMVPLYHWALRTHWLLRLGEDEARGLIQVANGIRIPEGPGYLSPEQQALSIARDLRDVHIDLEVLEDSPEEWIGAALGDPDPIGCLQFPLRLTQLRPRLEKMIDELVSAAGGPLPTGDEMDPFVSMIDHYLPPEVVRGLRTTGGRVTVCYEEMGRECPPVVADRDWGVAAGVVCDLGRCRRHAFALNGSEPLRTVAQWVSAQLNMELRDVKILLARKVRSHSGEFLRASSPTASRP